MGGGGAGRRDGIWQYWVDERDEFLDLDPEEFDAPAFVRETAWEKCRVPSTWNHQKREYMRHFGAAFYCVYVNNGWGHEDWLPWVRQVDWFNYGGIHRPVWLEVTGPETIADYTLTSEITFPDEHATRPARLRLHYHATPGVTPLGTTREAVTVSGNTSATVEGFLDVPATLRLWSPDDPALYPVRLTFTDETGAILDQRRWKWGFRTLETRGTRFYLNNRRFFMRGTNRHEDHPAVGCAVPVALQYEDLLVLKRAHVNTFRGSHYPNDERLLDLCDELGLFYVEEIPGWQLEPKHMANPAVVAAAMNIFSEMYRRDKNHACLCAWSMSNECHTEHPDGRAYHELLYQHARAVDQGTHFVTHVSNRRVMDRCYDLADFLTVNIYSGWYSADVADFLPQLELLHEILMDEDREFGVPKPIVLTEFGAGAIRGYRSWYHAKWSEDFQAELLQFYLVECQKRDYVGGTWTWMFCDARVDLPTRPDGRPRSYNNKGMVDEYRVPKLAYSVVRDQYARWKQREDELYADGTGRDPPSNS